MKKLLMFALFILWVLPVFAQITQTNPDSIPFAPPVTYEVGIGAEALFSTDLDGDGDNDLAVANTWSSNVSILLNNGDGTFQPAVNYAVGYGPSSIFCANLDGDGAQEVITADNCGNSISVLKNNGNGTFQPAVNYAVGMYPSSVFSVDIDQDGDFDIAVTNSGGNNISILKNNGDGTFQDTVNFPAGIHPWSIFSADLDHDGDYDLVVADSSYHANDSISVLKNCGNGTFEMQGRYGVGLHPRVFCADLDNDGDYDIAVANHLSSSLSILENNGDGTFQPAINYPAANLPRSIFCADLDGDSDFDLAVAHTYDNVAILRNDGSGSFENPTYYSTGMQTHTAYVFCADLDGDGDYDLIPSRERGGEQDSISVLLNLTQIQANKRPDHFSLLSPEDGDSSSFVATFHWATAYDPNLGDQIKYDLFISNSPQFPSGSTIVDSNLARSDHTDTLTFGIYYWKVKAKDNWGAETWSTQTWSFVVTPSSNPILSWTDEVGYLTDGVSPDTGLSGFLFTFRVVYSDSNNLPPQSGFPKVNIDLNGDGDFNDENEGSFTMGIADVDTNYVDGREYLYNATLPASSNCQYSFSAKNSYGLDAVGEPTNLKAGPVILTSDSALDIYIHSSDITFSNSHPDEGENFRVFATVHNNSDSNLTSVSVTFYHSGELLDQVMLSNVPSHGSATASTQISFGTRGFYPIRVVVDEENSFIEWNELNNFAMRPIIVGDYQFPGGIVVQAQLNTPVYPYSWITVTGNAHYTPEYLGSVSGATVKVTVRETGAEYTNYTNDPGNFSIGFYGPNEVGSYSVKVEVTDYTLTDSTILNLDVLLPQSGVDLTIRMTMPDTGCLSENEQNTVNMKIFNLGDQDAQNFWTHLYKDGSLYYRYWVDQLPAGDSLQIDTVISFSSTGSHSVTGIVDAGDSVSEYNEGNNISTINPYVSCGAPDIAIINVVFSDHILKGEKPIDITAWITNLGSVAVTEPFGVEFSDNGIPFDTQYISSLAPCGLQTVYVVSDSFIYSDTLPHSFKVFADFGNIVTECNEENNIYLSSISAWPDLWPRNLEFSRDCFTWGDSLWFQVDIYNVGEVKAESVWVRFLLDEVPIGGDVLIDSIPSGFGNYETRLSEEPWIVPEELDVTHVCRVVVDPDNEIPEIREDNNELTRATPVVRCGDITGDCVVDIGDIIYMINYLYKHGPTPSPLPAGDVNSDHVVDIGDVVYLINYLFKGGPSPCSQ